MWQSAYQWASQQKRAPQAQVRGSRASLPSHPLPRGIAGRPAKISGLLRGHEVGAWLGRGLPGLSGSSSVRALLTHITGNHWPLSKAKAAEAWTHGTHPGSDERWQSWALAHTGPWPRPVLAFDALGPWFPTSLARGTGFVGDSFSMDLIRTLQPGPLACTVYVGYVLLWKSNATNGLTGGGAQVVMQVMESGYKYRWSLLT